MGDIRLVWSTQDATVRLNEAELWKLRQLATWRNNPKMEAHVPNYKISTDKSDYDVHLLGLMAEYAVAVYFGEPMDLSIDLGGDNNVADLYLGPWSTSVRYASYVPPYLKFNSLEEFHQDVAILAGPGPLESCVSLYGWITPEYFQERCQRKDFGHGVRVCVEPKDLWPMRGLKSLLYDMIKFPRIRSWWGGTAGLEHSRPLQQDGD